MENDNYLKIWTSYYVRLTDGTPYGLNALKKHCFDPRKSKWVTLEMIESRRQELVGESGRWDDVPLFARDNPW